MKGPSKTGYAAELSVYFFTLVAIVLFGFINLYTPLTGDTALFLLGSESILKGESLYVDFWDNKQPGVYYFYYIAGLIFDFSPTGIHLFEILWWVTFSFFCFIMLRQYFDHPWLSAIVPLVAITVYYANLVPWVATQVEILVGFPILASVLLLGRSYRNGVGAAWGFAFAGVFAGLSVVFKLALAPMFVVFVLIATAERVRTAPSGDRVRFVAQVWLSFTLGVALVLAAICALFLANGAFDQFIWTTFVYPPQALTGSEAAPLVRLAKAVTWYLAAFAPWLPFAALAAVRGFRAGEPALTRLAVAWLIAGAAIILMQRFSWWTYHMTLLFVPTALLAARGIDVALTWLRDRAGADWKPRAVAIALLLLPGLAAVAIPARDKALDVAQALRNPEIGIAGYQREFQEFGQAARIAGVLNSEKASPDKIYVFGNPLIYLLSNTRQALPVHGWSWEFFLPEQWRALPGDLLRHRPTYIFVSPAMREIIDASNPEVWSVLDGHYRMVSESEDGQWYRLAAR
jgi:hypothetical protein